MSYSQHKISFHAPLRDVTLNDCREPLISERKFRQQLSDEYQRGIEAGQKALREQLVEARKQLLDVQNRVLRSLESAVPKLVDECEKSLVQLSLQCAQRVLQQMPVDGAMVESIVKSALSEVRDTAEYEVQLNPEDLALLTQMQSGLLPASPNGRVRFTANGQLANGD